MSFVNWNCYSSACNEFLLVTAKGVKAQKKLFKNTKVLENNVKWKSETKSNCREEFLLWSDCERWSVSGGTGELGHVLIALGWGGKWNEFHGEKNRETLGKLHEIFLFLNCTKLYWLSTWKGMADYRWCFTASAICSWMISKLDSDKAHKFTSRCITYFNNEVKLLNCLHHRSLHVI